MVEELQGDVVVDRQGSRSSADCSRNEQQVDLVHQAGLQRLRSQLDPADADVALLRLLQLSHGFRIEGALQPGAGGSDSVQGPRVDDLLGAAPDLGKVAYAGGL